MGSPEWAADAELSTAAGRARRVDDVERGVREWTAAHTREDVAGSLQKAGVPAGEMLTALESISNEHYLARGFKW